MGGIKKGKKRGSRVDLRCGMNNLCAYVGNLCFVKCGVSHCSLWAIQTISFPYTHTHTHTEMFKVHLKSSA